MSQQSAPPDVIYLIRHGEKPDEPAPRRSAPAHRGVDFHGNQNEHSLLPRGWQRSGALAALFDPSQGPLRAGLRVPRMLIRRAGSRPDLLGSCPHPRAGVRIAIGPRHRHPENVAR